MIQPCECGRVIPEDEHHCYIHHVDEWPADGVTYRTCWECAHVYLTSEDLEAAYQREILVLNASEILYRLTDPVPSVMEEPLQPKKAEDIYFCQECLHDF